jgi:hypothetical protein
MKALFFIILFVVFAFSRDCGWKDHLYIKDDKIKNFRSAATYIGDDAVEYSIVSKDYPNRKITFYSCAKGDFDKFIDTTKEINPFYHLCDGETTPWKIDIGELKPRTIIIVE